MRRILIAAVAALVLVPSALAVAPTGTVMRAILKGSSEVPKHAAGGSGTVTVRVAGPRRICWTFKLVGVTAPKAAHIHKGDPGKAGAVVIPLGKTYARTGCTAATAAAVVALVKHPRRFYVNVHNARYPGGAVRGQLHKLG
jgi:CHRD domain